MIDRFHDLKEYNAQEVAKLLDEMAKLRAILTEARMIIDHHYVKTVQPKRRALCEAWLERCDRLLKGTP